MSQDMCVPCGGGFINIRVGAIILKGDRFLMVRNARADYFYSVGGRIKFGETAEEAVVREVFEETGILMEIDHLGFVLENYFICDMPEKLGKEIYELSFFFYMKTPEDFEPVCSSFTENDHKEYLVWVSPDEPRTVFPEFYRTELDIHDKRVKHFVYDDRFFIRRMTLSDLEPLHVLLSDPDIMEYLEEPFTLQQTKAFLETRGLSGSPAVLAVENKDHEFIGYVIYHDYDGENNEIGWVLKKEVWGKGTASLLTKQLIAMACAEGKGVIIECVPEQLATKKIAENHGFIKTGTRDGLDVYQKQ